jgi:hypothetical protein
VTRTFIHSFDSASTSRVAGPTVDLEVSEIEDAGIPLAATGQGGTFRTGFADVKDQR